MNKIIGIATSKVKDKVNIPLELELWEEDILVVNMVLFFLIFLKTNLENSFFFFLDNQDEKLS
jgi:hypothetical protein